MSIDRQCAIKIIDKMKARLDFSLQITDERGIIIASTDRSRLNSFHELAYTMILSGKTNPIKITNASDYLGANTGVCMILRMGGEIVGAFSMIGDPDTLFSQSGLMQIALENALEYEWREQRNTSGNGNLNNFFSALIYREHASQTDLEMWAEQLNYETKIARAPIMFSFHGSKDAQKELTEQIRHSQAEQDIVAQTRDQQLIVFAALPPSEKNLTKTYETKISSLDTKVREFALLRDVTVRSYAGSIQEQLSSYNHGCQHCFWLRRRQPEAIELVRFYDHVTDYLYEQISTGELYHIFNVLSKHLDAKLAGHIPRVIRTLDQHNYNLVSSSKALFMHKNTLAALLNRIKEHTGTHPLKSSLDRKNLYALAYYLELIEGGKFTPMQK